MDNSNESSQQEEFVVSPSPAPVQLRLFQHWKARNEALRRLTEEAKTHKPPNKETDSIPEWMGKAKKHIDETNRLLLQIARIQGYLGRDRKSIDPEIVTAAHWKARAQWVRRLIENGESDEAVASFLRSAVEGERKDKGRGRPSGSTDCDSQAMLALAIHDSDSKYWTWPKLADWLLGCKIHERHAWDSDCTVRLKKTVYRLRAFIRELDSECTVK